MTGINNSPPRATHRGGFFTSEHMNEIVKSLVDRLDPNLKEAFEERAAIMEFDGGLCRDHAEALALLNLIHQNPQAVFACFQ